MKKMFSRNVFGHFALFISFASRGGVIISAVSAASTRCKLRAFLCLFFSAIKTESQSPPHETTLTNQTESTVTATAGSGQATATITSSCDGAAMATSEESTVAPSSAASTDPPRYSRPGLFQCADKSETKFTCVWTLLPCWRQPVLGTHQTRLICK